eukprot:12879806-Alexandrium_andersonii.AAC.1
MRRASMLVEMRGIGLQTRAEAPETAWSGPLAGESRLKPFWWSVVGGLAPPYDASTRALDRCSIAA